MTTPGQTTTPWAQTPRRPATPEGCAGVIAGMAARGETLTADEWQDLALGAGRIHGPALLWAAWWGDVIDADALAALVGSVWAMAEYPDRALSRAEWRGLFSVANYTVDGRRALLPTGPLTLWRGSVPERARDWSWSASREVAERYADGRVTGRQPGRLYRAEVHPSALLCSNTGHARDEAEYVVDTDLVDVINLIG